GPGAMPVTDGPPPTLRTAVTGQRRIVQVGALCILAARVIGIGLGEPAIGAFIAIGVFLAVVNAVLTEYSMARMVASGELLSKKKFAAGAMKQLGANSLLR